MGEFSTMALQTPATVPGPECCGQELLLLCFSVQDTTLQLRLLAQGQVI